MQSNNVKFVTSGSVVYRIGGNDWYAVSQDDETVLLVDTDAALPRTDGTLVGLESEWSDGKWNTIDGENGQTLLDYTNKLVDKYLGKIKYAMRPISIACDYEKCMYFSEPKNLKGSINEAYMFPLSYEELDSCRAIGGEIFKNSRENCNNLKNENGVYLSNSFVWTRTFSSIGSSGYRYVWYVSNAGGDLGGNGSVSDVFRVAPAFRLKKSYINNITEDGEIILKPEDMSCNDVMPESYSNVFGYVQSIVNIHDAEIKLHGYSDIPKEKVQLCRDILKLATGTVTEK